MTTIEPLWDAHLCARITGGDAGGSWQANRVSIDSRTIQPGDLFVAIKGDSLNGHDYVAQALEKGASAAIVSRPVDGIDTAKLLIVPDTLEALTKMAVFARGRTQARIVGVTGSVGKTSTKEMLKLALSAHGNTFASHGNFNNHIGLPLNLVNLPLDARFAVLEMGMNHAGEIAALTRIARPEVAVITNVEPVHLEFFSGVDAIADAKCEIFEGLSKNGTVVLNRDNAQFTRCENQAKRAGAAHIVSFGKHADADYRLQDYKADMNGAVIKANAHGRECNYRLGATGEHWAMISLIALAAVDALQCDVARSAQALAQFSEVEGRGRVIKTGGIWLVDDSYNASPASMRSSLARLNDLAALNPQARRRIAVLGDMLELGPTASELHAGLADAIQAAKVDAVFTAGKLMQHLHNALPESIRGTHAADAKSLLPTLLASLKDGDMVLVKGSHGSKMYEIARSLSELKEKAA